MTPAPTPLLPAAGALAPLRAVFRSHRLRLAVTYGLLNVENLIHLLQPLALGVAINGLLRGEAGGLGWLLAQLVGELAVGTARRVYDTRTFTAVYTALACDVVAAQTARGTDVSAVAARTALSREFVVFFEEQVPVAFRTAYSVGGALVMLPVYDWRLVPLCLGLLVPLAVVNRVYARYALRWSGRLNDRLEREVEAVRSADPAAVRGHFEGVAGCRVRLSDADALQYAAMSAFILVALAAALVLVCDGRHPAGDIFAALEYVVLFVAGLDAVPGVVAHVAKLRDIGRRLAG